MAPLNHLVAKHLDKLLEGPNVHLAANLATTWIQLSQVPLVQAVPVNGVTQCLNAWRSLLLLLQLLLQRQVFPNLSLCVQASEIHTHSF